MENSKSSVLGWVAIVIALIACGLAAFAGGEPRAGGVGTRYPDGLSADTTSPIAGQVRGTTALFTSTSAFSGLMTLNAGLLHANTISSSTNVTAQNLAVADVANYDTVIITPTIGSDTLTFFASSTATTWLPTAGNTQHTCFVNGTTTAATYLVIAGGTGVKIQVASSTATALGGTQIGPQKVGCIDFVRGNATATTFDILGTLTVYN